MKKVIISLLLLLGTSSAFTQSFLPGFGRFSGSKISYFNLTDGSTLEGSVEDFDRKKGLIKKVKINASNGNKTTLKAEQIKSMYVSPSNFAKLVNALDFATEVSSWTSGNDIDKDIISKGYVFLERVPVAMGRKKRLFLLQSANPSFSNYVKVYNNPMTKETKGIGVAGVSVVGGREKSYYVKVGDQPAFKLKKKKYRKQFNNIFKDCEIVRSTFGEKRYWRDFAKHAKMAATECK